MRNNFAWKMIHAIPVIVKDNEQNRIEYTRRTGESYNENSGSYWLGIIIAVLIVIFGTLTIVRTNFGWFQLKPIISEEETYKSAISCAVNSCGNPACFKSYDDIFQNGIYKEKLIEIINDQKNENKCKTPVPEIPRNPDPPALDPRKREPTSGSIYSPGDCNISITGGTVSGNNGCGQRRGVRRK